MTSHTAIYKALSTAYTTESGRPLAACLSPSHPAFTAFAFSSNPEHISHNAREELLAFRTLHYFNETELKSWIDVFVAHFRVAYALERSQGGRGDWEQAYAAQKDLAQAVIRGFSNSGWPNWLLSVLYETCKTLHKIAVSTDIYLVQQDPQKTEKWEKLEDAARIINRGFTVCISDRATINESRKWGTYFMANLVFKTYFKLNSVSLCKNVLNAIHASSNDIPPITSFPMAQRVTFLYYVGVIAFLAGDYEKAQKNLSEAFQLCHRDAEHNQELILTYLIPTNLAIHQTLPSARLLSSHPRLSSLFNPIIHAIRKGDLAGFDAALLHGEDQLVQKRIFLTLEKGREIAMRNALKRTWLCLEPEKRQRVPMEYFRIGLGIRSGLGVEGIDLEEVECMLTNMIASGLMKGYISHERGIIVLSAKDPFPGTGPLPTS